MKETSRGIRNNNPGNIRKTTTMWKGEVPGTDRSFKSFRSLAYGYRALIWLLQQYQTKHGLRTITQIISRWAPSNENYTAGYIASVSKYTGFGRQQVLDMFDRRMAVLMAAAISKVENGQEPSMDDIARGWDLLNEK